MATHDLPRPADYPEDAATGIRIVRSGTVVKGTVEYRSRHALPARICRESPLTKGSRIILGLGKGARRLSLPPARTGAGRARISGQGTSPLRVLRAAP